MMQSRSIEIAVGLFVAAGMAALFMLAMKVSNLSAFQESGGYTLVARFENIGGLTVRAPVKMAGVTIGRVKEISFDSLTYQAVVKMNIEPSYNTLPTDTSASILTAGLLGEQYIGLDAGGDIRYLKDGGEIKLTQSALVLEQMVGQFLFSKAQESSGSN